MGTLIGIIKLIFALLLRRYLEWRTFSMWGNELKVRSCRHFFRMRGAWFNNGSLFFFCSMSVWSGIYRLTMWLWNLLLRSLLLLLLWVKLRSIIIYIYWGSFNMMNFFGWSICLEGLLWKWSLLTITQCRFI